ncbi:DUF4259 domain-containing protein [Massilia sp. 2TAF26]|uniref:DUF4259 domain-containing protein n=1 Tax=Massilia sp. 2TAF26 TaxID=3233012 RepID=UPI003F9D1980
MGAWSHESFGNDDACDWAAQLDEYDDLSLVEATLDTVLEAGDDELEAPEASEAIAAAEVVARLQGNPGTADALPEELDAWVERIRLLPSADLAAKARRALDRVLAGPSELMELWDESGESEAWQASVRELKDRIRI